MNLWKEKTVYQIWPRSFLDTDGDGIGDLQGVIKKLNYLKELGIDLIWLSPIYSSPNDDYGYDISDYYTINPEYGTMRDFDELLSESKKLGIGVVMDLVANHTSDQHIWFKEAIKDKNSKYRDYYYFAAGKNGSPPNNWMSFFGGSSWQKVKNEENTYYLTSFTPSQCDINWENPELRREIYKMMRFWLDKGIAGFRMDVINVIKKAPGLPDKDPDKKGLQFPQELICNQPGVHEFIQEMRREVLDKYDCFTVGEGALTTAEDVIAFTKEDRNELGMMFQFDLHMLGCGPLGKFDFRKLYRYTVRDMKNVITHWQNVMQKGGGWIGNYLSNHDQPRHISRFGNDREFRVQCAKAYCMLNFTLMGTPFMYQGEECGMTNCRLEEHEWKDYEAINDYKVLRSMMHLPKSVAKRIIIKMTRDNARTPVQWSGSKNAGFTRGVPWIKLNPNYQEVNIADDINTYDSIVNFYKRMIAFRKEHIGLFTYGEYAPVFENHRQVIGYTRKNGDKSVLVVINLTDKPANIKLSGKCVLHTHHDAHADGLRPFEGRIYLL